MNIPKKNQKGAGGLSNTCYSFSRDYFKIKLVEP